VAKITKRFVRNQLTNQENYVPFHFCPRFFIAFYLGNCCWKVWLRILLLLVFFCHFNTNSTLSKESNRDLKDRFYTSRESSSPLFRSMEKSKMILRSMISAMVVRQCFKGRAVTSFPNCINSFRNSNVCYLFSLFRKK